MKKILSLLIAATMALTPLAVSANPKGGEPIKKGTAEIDAELDPEYLGSLCIKGIGTEAPIHEQAPGEEWQYTASADVYIMYDDENLYLFADVVDDDAATAGRQVAMSADNPIDNDVFEFRLSMDGDEVNTIKFSIDAYGFQCFGLPAHYERYDYDLVEWKTELTDDGYHIEIAVPCTKGNMDIFKVGKVGFAAELNDYNPDDFSVGRTTYATPARYDAPYFFPLSDAVAQPGVLPSTDTTALVTEADTTTAVTASEDTSADDTTPVVILPEDNFDDDVDDTTADAETSEELDTTEASDDTTAEDTTAGDSASAGDTTEKDTSEDTDTNVDNIPTTGEANSNIAPIVIGIVAAVVVIAAIAFGVIKAKKK